MGTRLRPGTTSRLDGGNRGGEQLTGLAAIAQFGEGPQDANGRYAFYNIPSGHAASRTKAEQGEPVRWTEIVEQRQRLVADFRSEYGVDLDDEFDDMPWPWFEDHVAGLMQANTRLGRHFAPKPSSRGR